MDSMEKKVLAILFFDILRSIGASRKSGFNRLVGRDYSIWVIRGC